MSQEKKQNLCEKACANEFVTCMQMALDSFAMGACYDAEKFCEQRCTIKNHHKDKLDFDPSLASKLSSLP